MKGIKFSCTVLSFQSCQNVKSPLVYFAFMHFSNANDDCNSYLSSVLCLLVMSNIAPLEALCRDIINWFLRATAACFIAHKVVFFLCCKPVWWWGSLFSYQPGASLNCRTMD